MCEVRSRKNGQEQNKKEKKYSGQQQKEIDCDEPHPAPNEKTQPIQWTERSTGALVAVNSLWPYEWSHGLGMCGHSMGGCEFVVPMWNNAATSWNCCWLQGGLPVPISITVPAGNTVSLPVITRLTNDLRSHPVRRCVSWTSASEMVASLTTFLDAPKSASFIRPMLSTRMFAPFVDNTMLICNPCGQSYSIY